MTDENLNKDSAENVGNVPQGPLLIHKQYLKDLSFENPNAPDILLTGKSRPAMEMNLGVDVQKIEHEEKEHFYEVSLTVNARADRDGQNMFICEAVYCAAVSISGLEEPKHHPLLFIEVPHMLFPYIRQIVTNSTQSGGFIPLQLSPVDFRSMYLARFGDKEPENPEADS